MKKDEWRGLMTALFVAFVLLTGGGIWVLVGFGPTAIFAGLVCFALSCGAYIRSVKDG